VRKLVARLNFSQVSARPRHPVQDAAASLSWVRIDERAKGIPPLNLAARR
jgi:hypothetical protein